VLAVVRQHSWDLAVFVHVLGAMTLVGAHAHDDPAGKGDREQRQRREPAQGAA
jgi:hypothetical protein